MRGRNSPTPPVPTVSTGTASVAISWRRCAERPMCGSELAETIGQPMQRLGRLAWRQEDEIVDVASEPLALLQRRRQVGQVGGVLQALRREPLDRLEASSLDVIAAVAEIPEVGLGAGQSARRQALVDFDQHARPAAPDRLYCAVQDGLLVAFDVD